MSTLYVNTIYGAIIHNMDETLGAFIRRKRTERGWNQTQLSEHSGVDRPYLSQIESGKVGLPGAGVRRQIAQALGLRHIDLLVAAGELTGDEAGQSDDERSYVIRRLTPVVDSYAWSEEDVEQLVRVIDSVGRLHAGTFPGQKTEE